MHKINTDTATSGGEFTDGDEGQAIPPTDLNAAWFNSVQRELIAILTGMGVSPDDNNDAQIWTILKKIGIRCLYSDDAEVDVTGFSGATVIFHSAEDFELVGSLSSQSFVVIVPFWVNSSPDEITVEYNADSIDIDKHWMFIGFAANGLDELQLAGTYLPMASSEGLGGTIDIGGVNAGFVKASKRFETSLVQFAVEVNAEGLPAQWAWQLASAWQVGQVKRVYCTNVVLDVGEGIPVINSATGDPVNVNFYKGSFREFMCIGTRSYELASGTYTFAILVCNGKN